MLLLERLMIRVLQFLLKFKKTRGLVREQVLQTFQELPSTTKKISIRKRTMVFSPDSKSSDTRSILRIILAVVRTRGLTRTIIYLFGEKVDTNVNYVSKWTRLEVSDWVWVNRALIFQAFLTKVTLQSVALAQGDQIQRLTKQHFVSDTYKPIFNLSQEISFENQAEKTYFQKDSSIKKKSAAGAPIFKSLLQRNTKMAFDLIRILELEHLVTSLQEEFYSDLIRVFNEESSLVVETIPASLFSIDQISQLPLAKAVQRFDNVEVWHQRFVVQRDRLLVIDATANPKLSFVAGQWQFIRKIKGDRNLISLKKPTGADSFIDRAIFLMGRVDENWYHFLLDTLPRLLILDELDRDIPLLVRSDIPKHFKELVQRLSSRAIIEVDVEVKLKVAQLYTLPARATIFDSKPITDTPLLELSPKMLLRLRSQILNTVNTHDSHLRDSKKIAIHRKSSMRNVTNWDSLVDVLEQFNVEILSDGSDWYKSQVALFSRSKLIVLSGGAAVTNLLFMNADQTCVLFINPASKRLGLWRKLASISGVNLIEINGTTRKLSFGKAEILHANFYINPKKLERTLSTLITSKR